MLMKTELGLDGSRPSSFCLKEETVIHSRCGAPMTLWQRAAWGEEQWFCLTCRESVFIPREAWLFLAEQVSAAPRE